MNEKPISNVQLFWDFFGPHAGPTGQHFMTHLQEFLQRESVLYKDVGNSMDPTQSHCSVWCVTSEEESAKLEKALKPRRKKIL